LQRPARFGELPAPLSEGFWLTALSWFFGPSLLPRFQGSLHYYGLCWLLARSHAQDLPG